MLFSFPTFASETVSIAVASVVGGAPWNNALIVSKYMQKYLPGNPKVVVTQMNGAGGVVLGNWLYNVADPENTIGTVTGSGGAIIGALTPNENIKYDLDKFNWLFATTDTDNPVYCIWATNKNGLTNINQMLVPENKFIYGTQDVASGESNIQLYIVKNILGIKSNIVVGYKDTRQAILNGEIDARFSSLSGQLLLNPDILNPNSQIKPILQFGSDKRNTLIPDVPLLEEKVTNEDHKKVLRLFTLTNRISRPYFSSPKMSEKRVKEFMKAAELMEKDPEYQSEFKTTNKVIQHKEFNAMIKDIVATDKSILKLIN
jgi:hypothetical protein